jgi:hypothetical protein
MHRCNLNVSVMNSWWEKQLGVSPSLSSDEKFALVEQAFPGLITYRPEEAAPAAPDPNHGYTMYKALGAKVEPNSIGGYEVVPVSVGEAMAMTVPDYDVSGPVQALRESIRETRARFGRAANSSFSGLFTMALRLRGQEIFYDFFERPEMVRHLVSVTTDTLERHLMFLKSECGDIPYFVLGSCSNCMISPDIYEEFFREGEARISRLSTYIKGRERAMGIHHCGTKVDSYLGTYSRIPELEMLEANYQSDIDAAARAMPGLKFKPMIDPIEFDSFDVETIESILFRLLENESVEEIQAFDLSQFFTVEKLRRMLEVVLDFNGSHGLPGYTRFFT